MICLWLDLRTMEEEPVLITASLWENVLYGSGNDGKTGYEGVVYKNVIGTYLHGPLLPKNPQLADWLIAHALEQKYGKEVQLAPLDDTEEKAANDYVYHRFVKEN